jgi:hypothetical protein
MGDEKRRHVFWIVVLGVGSMLSVVWLRRNYNWGDASSIVTVVALPTVAIGLYATLTGLVGGRSPEPADLDKLADGLAIGVQRQWQAEEGLRRVNDPRSLPVRWQATAAAQAVADAWADVEGLAADGARRRPPDPAGTPTPATDPNQLDGEFSEIADRFLAVPSRRLVIVGEPGAGKSVLALRLVLDLLARRAPSGAVPVLVSVASWRPIEQDFHDWFVNQLIATYPGLAERVATADGPTTAASALIAANRIIAIVDGLDEIPTAVRGATLVALNQALSGGHQFVATSRLTDYQLTVDPPGRVGVRLTAAAVVEIMPLGASAVRDWLRASAPDPATAAQWTPVTDVLSAAPTGPIGQALRTPLMVSLARTIYTPAPGTPTSAVRNPGELSDASRFPTREDVEQWLFDGLIPAVYPRHRGVSGPDGKPSRWTSEQADSHHVFLARHLEHRLHTTNLAWWQLARATPAALYIVVFGFLGVAIGILIGWSTYGHVGVRGSIQALTFGRTDVGGYLYAGTVEGAAIGILAGVAARLGTLSDAPPMRVVLRRPTTASLASAVVFGVVLGVVCGVAVAVGGGVGGGVAVGIAVGIAGGVAVGIAANVATDQDATKVVSAAASLRDDLRSSIVFGVVFGAAASVAAGVLGGVAGGIAGGIAFGVAGGIVFGVCATVFMGGGGAVAFEVACPWLAWKGNLPLAAVEFMIDAHRRGVLRQVGPYYQFRHRDLQRRLATR